MISFDDFPIVYFALGYALSVGVVLLFFLRKNISYFPAIILAFGATLLVAMRLPVVIFNQEINPDESQMIAHALTLKHYPIYWESVDGTTIGPVNNYMLLLPAFLGLGFDYIAIRLLGLVWVLGSLFFFYHSVKNFFDVPTALLSLLPPLFFLSFTQDLDFVHYSSEQLPVFLLNAALWRVSKMAAGSQDGFAGIFFLGLLLGLNPFAKIQVVPQAAVIGLFAVITLYQHKHFLKACLVLIAGSLIIPVSIIALAGAFGVLDDLWDYYVLGNLIYAGGSSLIDAIVRVPSFFAKSTDFLLYLGSLILLIALSIFQKNKQVLKANGLTVFIVLWLLAALYAATKTGNDFGHYLNLCVYPLALLAALFISKLQKSGARVPITAFLALAPFLVSFGFKSTRHRPLNAYISGIDHRVPVSSVSQLMLKHAQPTDRLVVWGWMCRYHVETQMPQGTAENHSERCIYPHPLRQKYYERYLNDLRKNRPKVFVDAVGNSLWLNDRASQAHEAFPELKEFIEKNYRFVGETEHTRVYILIAEN
ncbi:hypothetical protein [Runella slithyformis]|uniref:Glycosyltransferase RgtA/B/C/D-like domain-containing protein n=1 Tax=Runella slithyformis (strain ATCC 29530 / DSM 19594 / LMG 11500 / NCIMB 11436 / LSU 4) TaxID=761193 RepID=A0A7U3ZIR1_RUNSL|nr:hypothetical protein [Runella slithyformis]AEI47952.1 hypothetical protein Runsl_1527 [Runella slithyformis DSM 19594]